MKENPVQKALSAESDEQLLRLSIHENAEAMAALILRYLPVVRKIASRFSAAGAEHDDFVQEGLIGFLSAVRTFRADEGCGFNPYARVCILNRIKKAVGFVSTGKYTLLSGAEDLQAVREEPVDRSADPEQMLLEQELFRSFSEQIGEILSGKEKTVFLLYLEGYESAQIAERCGMEPKQVYNALGRARRKLQTSFLPG